MIPNTDKEHFATLLSAANLGRLALIETQEKATGKRVTAIAVVNHVDGQYGFLPIAKLFDGHPYDELNPPNAAGGFHSDAEG